MKELQRGALNLTDTQSMAVAMFKDSIPCFFPDVDCHNPGEWIITPAHVTPIDCEEIPSPVCNMHKRLIEKANSPFWLMFACIPAPTCEKCGIEVRAEFKPICENSPEQKFREV